MSTGPRLLAVGTLCMTLERLEPANAGRIVVVLAHEGAMEDLGFSDGYFVEVADGSRPLIAFTCDGPGEPQEVCGHKLKVYVDRCRLVPIVEPGALDSANDSSAVPSQQPAEAAASTRAGAPRIDDLQGK